MHSAEVVVFGQEWLCLGKICFVRAKVVVCGTGGCIWAKVVIFLERGFYSGKVVLFGKIEVFGQKWFYSGNSGCNRAKWMYSGKRVVFGKIEVFGQKWFYWGNSGKRVVFWQKLLFSNKKCCTRQSGIIGAKVVVLGQSGCIRAKVVVFR